MRVGYTNKYYLCAEPPEDNILGPEQQCSIQTSEQYIQNKTLTKD